MKNELINQIVDLINRSHSIVAFTGAGISAESKIPTFRDDDGIWKKYNPQLLELNTFISNPAPSWKAIKEIFYSTFANAEPNEAHYALAELEKMGKLRTIITQNIDNLHQKSGSKNIIEFHGNSQKLICLECGAIYNVVEVNLNEDVPKCNLCKGILKPDFVFFGENINPKVHNMSIREAQICDLILIIGTSGEVFPAALIPENAKFYGATIVEFNTKPSNYTNSITDFFIEGKASKTLSKIVNLYKQKYF